MIKLPSFKTKNLRIIVILTFALLGSFIISSNTSASEIAPGNNQVYVKSGAGWNSFGNDNQQWVNANYWVTGQRGVIAIPGQRGDFYSGTVDFYVSYIEGGANGYYNGDSSNLQCFATQNGTLWNAIGNKRFNVESFSIEQLIGLNGANPGYRIRASFSGQSNEIITSTNNFACEFYLPSGLIFQAGSTGTMIRNGFRSYPSQPYIHSDITVSFASDATGAISNLQSLLQGQNQQIIDQNSIIINQNQATQNIIQQNNEWMQSTAPPNVDTSSLGSSAGWLPPGPVDSILTLPLQLLQSIINVFSGSNSCSALSVPVPFVSRNIELPCISALMDEVGFTPIWSIVGGVISAVLIWQTLQWLYDFVDKTLTFRENNSGLWGGL